MKSLRFLSFIVIAISLSLPAFAGDCEKGIELYNKGTKSSDYSKKAALFKEALGCCDDPIILAKIHNNLGDAYENMGRIDDAKNEYKEAIKNDRSLSTAHFSLGDIYFNKGDYEYAIEWYEMGLDLKYDELSKNNLEKARNKAPDYKSKKDIVAALDPSRALGVVAKIDFKIEFDYDSDKINSASERQLEAIADALKGNLNGYKFDVVGHTCSKGSDQYNMDLSKRRAVSVVRYLESKHGISSLRFTAMGKGMTQPVASNDTEAGRSKNRRVEFINTGKE